MTTFQKFSLIFLRLSLGGLFLYAGITKVLDPSWSAAGYLAGAKNFPTLFAWFASPTILPTVNFLNEWGLTLLGASLILGLAVRLSSWLGAALMLLYYLALPFPYPNAHALIIDEHIIYIFALLVLAAYDAGSVWSLSWRRG